MTYARHGLVLALVVSFAGTKPSFAELSYDEWVKVRAARLADPSLVRYYTFEAGSGDPSDPIPNLVGNEGALLRGVANGPDEPLQRLAGRWPEKPAVSLDRTFLYSAPFDIADRQFTVEAWIRVRGPGSLHGDAPAQTGTLLSVGIGYWDGWRVTMSYPERRLGFEIGRPAPVNAFSIRTAQVPDRVWHHLAITWDGKQPRIYLNGILMAKGDYEGQYTRPRPGAQFRVGFAGYGWGSCVLDVDEVAVYKRALAPADVLRSAYPSGALTNEILDRFLKANEAFDSGDMATATTEFRALGAIPDISPEIAALARLKLGQALLAQQEVGEALSVLSAVLQTPGVPEGLKAMALVPLLRVATASADAPIALYEELLKRTEGLLPRDVAHLRLGLACRYASDGKHSQAEEQFREVFRMSELSPREKLDAFLQAAHAAVRAGEYEAARNQYTAVLQADEAPPQYRSLAQLCIARTYRQQKEWTEALRAYQGVRELTDAPPSHIWEAGEGLREVERLRAGQPVRDPAWSRVKLPPRPQPDVKLYVATNGSDTNPGTADSPLATLRGARDAVRRLKTQGLPPGGVAVIIRAGVYQTTETLTLGPEDSGTQQAPISYSAEKPGTVTLTGGQRIEGFEPVTDPAILARVPEEARGRVMQLDLRRQGITDFGEMTPRGMTRPAAPVVELYFDGRPMPLARWPNEGFARTGRVVDPKGVFQYDGDRPSRWVQAKDAWLFGYFRWLWADDAVPLASVNAENHQITMGIPTGYGETIEGAPYYVFNLLEEIDQPGEWYLSRETGVLFFFPPSDPSAADVRVSMLSLPFVEMTNVSWVTIEGLTLELGRADGVIIRGGERCLLRDCTIRQMGGTAVTIDGGRNHGVLGCDLHTLGRNGTWVRGGDRKTLTPGGHFVENCRIYDFSRLWRTYTPAFWTDGVGNRFAHNLVYNSPGHALRIEGDEHVIEFNEVHHVCLETDDQGALDMYGNPTYRGVVIRYNFWHDIGNEAGLGQAGIRLDDAICDVLVYGNVFYRCSRHLFGAVQIHGGKDNVVENNLFVDCNYAVSFSGWGPERWKQFLQNPDVVKAMTRDIDISAPPRSTRYPRLARLNENEGVNSVWRNVAFKCGELLTRDRGIQDLMDNHVIVEDPGFVNAAALDFRLKPESHLSTAGSFRPIPFEEIGPY